MLEILYQDEHIIAINKPHGLMVHRSKLSGNTDVFAVQELRDQIGSYVYPIHRLDRKTSGVLLFAIDQEVIALLQKQFQENSIKKMYWAILRGYTESEGHIDYALTNDSGKTQEAITDYTTLNQSEIDLPFGKFQTSRYSWVEARPKTGRMHQLRKHFAHINHPIIGDRPHGCNKQNKLFLEKWEMDKMLLHAKKLEFVHPVSEKVFQIEATHSAEFERMLKILKLYPSYKE